MTRQLYVVTGANRGIGLAITKQLVRLGHQVVMGCRNEDRTMKAMQLIVNELTDVPSAKDQMEFIPFDLENPGTFESFSEIFKFLFKGRKANGLINNAGFAFSHDATEPVFIQASKTVTINFTNTAAFTEIFLSNVVDGGRIVFVGSRCGLLSNLQTESYRKYLLSDTLTISGLRKFMDEYLEATKTGTYSKFTNTTYGMSKIGINIFARLLSRDPEVQSRGIIVNACCPGWCRTDMTQGEGRKSADEGADTPVWLATQTNVATGKFFGERTEIDLLSEW